MKITGIKIQFEEMDDGTLGLACRVTTDDGRNLGCAQPWMEPKSPRDAASYLRAFATVIERIKQAEAA